MGAKENKAREAGWVELGEHACKWDKTIGGLQQSVKNLEGWQRTQNGNISRVEAKIDKLIFWAMTAAVVFGAGLVANIALMLLGKGGS